MVQPPPHFQTGHTQGRDPNTRRGRGALPFWAAAVLVTGSETGARGGGGAVTLAGLGGGSRVEPGFRGAGVSDTQVPPACLDSPATTCCTGESYSPTSHAPRTPPASGLPKGSPTAPRVRDPTLRAVVEAPPHEPQSRGSDIHSGSKPHPRQVQDAPASGSVAPSPGTSKIPCHGPPTLRVQNFGDTLSTSCNRRSRT